MPTRSNQPETALSVTASKTAGWRAETRAPGYEQAFAAQVSFGFLEKLAKSGIFKQADQLEGLLESMKEAQRVDGQSTIMGPDGQGIVMTGIAEGEIAVVVACSFSSEEPVPMGLTIMNTRYDERTDYLVLPEHPREPADMKRILTEGGYPYTNGLKTKVDGGLYGEGVEIYGVDGKSIYAYDSFVRTDDRGGRKEWNLYRLVKSEV